MNFSIWQLNGTCQIWLVWLHKSILGNNKLSRNLKWSLTFCIHPEKVPASVIPAENSELHSVPKFKRDLRRYFLILRFIFCSLLFCFILFCFMNLFPFWSFCRCLIASGSDYKSFDVKFSMKDEPGKAIFAHKAILAQRSPYFRAVRLLTPSFSSFFLLTSFLPLPSSFTDVHRRNKRKNIIRSGDEWVWTFGFPDGHWVLLHWWCEIHWWLHCCWSIGCREQIMVREERGRGRVRGRRDKK